MSDAGGDSGSSDKSADDPKTNGSGNVAKVSRKSSKGEGKSGAGDSVSTRPYLIRAIFDWCLDCGFTPQIMVNVDQPTVVVPLDYAKDGKIVLNLHPNSVRGLEMGNEYLMFSARFSGRAEEITVPVQAVMAIYARENGQGIVFQADGSSMTPPEQPRADNRTDAPKTAPKTVSENTAPETEEKPARRDGSHLKVIK